MYVCGTIPSVFWDNYPNCTLQGALQGKRSHMQSFDATSTADPKRNPLPNTHFDAIPVNHFNGDTCETLCSVKQPLSSSHTVFEIVSPICTATAKLTPSFLETLQSGSERVGPVHSFRTKYALSGSHCGGRASKGQVWTRHLAPATPAFTWPSLPSQFTTCSTCHLIVHWLIVLLLTLPDLGKRQGMLALGIIAWSRLDMFRAGLWLEIGGGGFTLVPDIAAHRRPHPVSLRGVLPPPKSPRVLVENPVHETRTHAFSICKNSNLIGVRQLLQ